MGLIQTKINGAVRVLVLDATGPSATWEHACAQKIHADIQASGVSVVGAGPVQPADLAALVEVFETVQPEDFNVLLLVAHGWAGDDSTPAGVQVGDLETNWYLLHQVSMHLEDKLVLLCVCEGFCGDTIDTFVHGDHFALTLVGSDKPLSRAEAEGFFPAFLHALHELSYRSIDPDVVQLVLDENNPRAHDKMHVFSAV